MFACIHLCVCEIAPIAVFSNTSVNVHVFLQKCNSNVMVVCPCVGFASEFIFMCVLLNMCSCVFVCVCVSCHVQGSCVVTVWLLFGDLVVPLWTC